MNTFKKRERLCSEKAIGKIFNNGDVFHIYPFKVLWLITESKNKYPIRLAISVPKKNITKAVTRNNIKRRIREAFRNNKKECCLNLINNQVSIDVVWVYLSKEPLPFKVIQSKVIEVLARLSLINKP